MIVFFDGLEKRFEVTLEAIIGAAFSCLSQDYVLGKKGKHLPVGKIAPVVSGQKDLDRLVGHEGYHVPTSVELRRTGGEVELSCTVSYGQDMIDFFVAPYQGQWVVKSAHCRRGVIEKNTTPQ